MNKKHLFYVCSSLLLHTIPAFSAQSAVQQECKKAPRPYMASVSHIEGKGVGYNQGYTSAELFFSPVYDNCVPLIDLRGHVFDNGYFAANGGLGYRHIYGDIVFGGNVFYDYRNTHRQHYNQIGAGLEVLGRRWDFRINGYLPVGTKESSWYGHKFGGFKNHFLLVKRNQQYSMKGINAEAGVFSNRMNSFQFYGGLGPYYYEGKGKNAYGGKVRLNGKFREFITLELSGSYDNVFHGIVQGQLTFSVPFGPRQRIQQKDSSRSCSSLEAVRDRAAQPIVRNEIIVTNHRHKNFVAINPATGLPYFFIFVNNTSHSAGTFESPYPTLDQALSVSNPGNILYIYPGDGTTNGLSPIANNTFQLLDNQQLLGAGFSYTFPTTLGNVTVPALASGRPSLINNVNAPVLITPGNNNTIAGLQIATDPTLGGNICIGTTQQLTNLTVLNNLIEPAGPNDFGVSIENGIGSFVIQNNAFEGSTNGNTAIELYSVGGLSASISQNTMDGFMNGAIDIQNFTTSPMFAVIQNNVMTNMRTPINAANNTTGGAIFRILSNSYNSTSDYVDVYSGPGGTVCLRFQNNNGTGGTGYSFENFSTFNLEPFTGNTPSTYSTPDSPVTLVPQNTCQ